MSKEIVKNEITETKSFLASKYNVDVIDIEHIEVKGTEYYKFIDPKINDVKVIKTINYNNQKSIVEVKFVPLTNLAVHQNGYMDLTPEFTKRLNKIEDEVHRREIIRLIEVSRDLKFKAISFEDAIAIDVDNNMKLVNSDDNVKVLVLQTPSNSAVVKDVIIALLAGFASGLLLAIILMMRMM